MVYYLKTHFSFNPPGWAAPSHGLSTFLYSGCVIFQNTSPLYIMEGGGSGVGGFKPLVMCFLQEEKPCLM